MKITSVFALLFIAAGAFTSCSKDDKNETGPSANETKAKEFATFMQSKNFQIADYYSDKPIDYDETDNVVKSETDLWSYVSPWLKDDYNVFSFNESGQGTVTITQNSIKKDTIPENVFTKNVSITSDSKSVYFNFLSHTYEPLKYYLVEFTDDHFIIYADWHSGEKVFTRFEVVKP